MVVRKCEKTSVGRADLLKILHRHGEKYLEVMAEFAGYERVGKKEEATTESDEHGIKTPVPTTPKVTHEFPETGEKTKFWYVAKYRRKRNDEVVNQEPAWTLGDTFVDGEIRTDSTQMPPSTPLLVPWYRLWPFLKSAIGSTGKRRSIDMAKVVESAARLKPVSRLPRKKRRGWAPRSNIILDFDERLVPFWDDMNAARRGIEKLRGHSGLEICTIDRGPDGSFKKQGLPFAPDKSFRLPEPGTPILIVSDLGCFEPSGWVTKTWICFGRRLKNAGVTAVVLTPCPPRLWAKELLSYFRLAWWDRGRRLPRNLSAISLSDPVAADEEGKRVDRLLALLSPAIRVEPSLLRSVRFLLASKEADSGTEGFVWNHRHVDRCPLAFMYQEQFVEKYRQAFSEEEEDLRKQVISLIKEHHLHLSDAVKCEEKIISSTLEGDSADWAETFMEKYFRTIDNKKFSGQQGLKAWFHRLTDRQHTEIWEKNKILTACWFKINRNDWEKGKVRLKPGMRIDDVAWMIREKESTEYTVFQAGDILLLGNRNLFQDKKTADRFTTGSPLVTLTAGRPYLQVFHLDGNDRLDEIFDLSLDWLMRLHIPPKGHLIFDTDHEEIIAESMEMPSWAGSIGRDLHGLFVTPREGDTGRKIYWFNPGRYLVKYDKDVKYDNGVEYDEEIIINAGFWGDGIGVDRYGLYVDFILKGVSQRMRWIKPGKFMMGSPEDEPGRYDDELLHEVTLTEGFWLGETTCTQELWEAVMGNNPSGFKGKKRPVENVSWHDCNEFIKKINEIADLGFRLPSEAEWEYACRAGTQTPFSFGYNITTDQVNYNGNYPYFGGKKGKYREETVDVKSLPCNDWGLYEMHGNVWEWCSDWFGNYEKKIAVAPVGPDVGTTRVLRGGSWLNYARYARSVSSIRFEPGAHHYNAGFRLAQGHKSGFQRS